MQVVWPWLVDMTAAFLKPMGRAQAGEKQKVWSLDPMNRVAGLDMVAVDMIMTLLTV